MDTSSTAPDLTALTTLRLAEYSRSKATGRRLLAQFTDRTVVVYQAYKPELGVFAAEHDYFGGGFSFQRTSWIKPNFTWMMYRCGWASKKDQEVVLALHLRRDYWDSVLSQAVMSNYEAHLSTQPEAAEAEAAAQAQAQAAAQAEAGGAAQPEDSAGGGGTYSSSGTNRWRSSLRASNVVVQWDPEHKPFTGHKEGYRVIQLGLRKDALAAFKGPAFGEGGIENVTAFAKATKARHAGREAGAMEGLLLPAEDLYPVQNAQVAQRLGVD